MRSGGCWKLTAGCIAGAGSRDLACMTIGQSLRFEDC